MSDFTLALLLSTLAGASIPVGAGLGAISGLHPGWLGNPARHSIIAFGGGALFSAVALVLVPEGSRMLPVWAVALWFAAGGIAFYALDRLLKRSGGAGAQFVAMLSDFIPEALALGAAFAKGESTAPLLAGLIALQNLPEAFNAQRELAERAPKTAGTTWKFLPLALVGPLAATLGFHVLADHQAILGALMVFSAGGIFYLVFEDIAPNAYLENRGAPALGAVLGFLLGLVGYLLTAG